MKSAKKIGKLLVITGLSGSGKDTIIDEFLSRFPHYRRLVTLTDRNPREGEIEGIHYYFVSPEELDSLYRKNMLVEKPLKYGTSRKATPKHEFKKILKDGNHLVWRIDTSLAAGVASGEFFKRIFSVTEHELLKQATKVVFVKAPIDDLKIRRQFRDKTQHDQSNYSRRDEHDKLTLKKYESHFEHIVVNKTGKLKESVDHVVEVIGEKPNPE